MTCSEQALPVAYITLGGAGSGKSTLSRRVSSLTGAVYLDKDTLAGPLVQVALEALGQDPTDRESNALYLEKIMPAEYETLFATAGQTLELGHSVVLDAPFVAYLDDRAVAPENVGAEHLTNYLAFVTTRSLRRFNPPRQPAVGRFGGNLI